ncbi:MAG: AbiH family protein [Dysgonomonas sp.]
MNRIILIGNGFDLAHGMKTSYRDFIDDYWADFAKETSNSFPYEDEFVKLENINGDRKVYEAWTSENKEFRLFVDEVTNVNSYSDFKQSIVKLNDTSDLQFALSFKNDFWEQISKHVSDKSWVDIENEFYEKLKKCSSDQIKILNKEFKRI